MFVRDNLFMFLLVLLCLLSVGYTKPRLSFSVDGTFKILQVGFFSTCSLQITDTHYGQNLNADVNTTDIKRTLLDIEHPDFVAFTGDMVAGTLSSVFVTVQEVTGITRRAGSVIVGCTGRFR